MTLIPMIRNLTPETLAAIECIRTKCGKTPFLCLNDHVMLLLTPGRTEEALMEEARALMAANLAARPAVFVHTLPGSRRMVRTIKDLCVLETRPGMYCGTLLQEGLEACRSGQAVALVIPDADDDADDGAVAA